MCLQERSVLASNPVVGWLWRVTQQDGQTVAPQDIKTDGLQSDGSDEFTISISPAAMARVGEGRPRS